MRFLVQAVVRTGWLMVLGFALIRVLERER